MTERKNGQTRALQERSLFQAQHYATSVYRSELAVRLQQLSYEIERGQHGQPEIKAIHNNIWKHPVHAGSRSRSIYRRSAEMVLVQRRLLLIARETVKTCYRMMRCYSGIVNSLQSSVINRTALSCRRGSRHSITHRNLRRQHRNR
jgi:hypothetical protein